jgi:hypothetical protein
MEIANIESPYAAQSEDLMLTHILYARMACSWAIKQGYSPYASHLLYTQPGILNDDKPEERALGFELATAMVKKCADVSLFFMDLGESSGMKYGRELALKEGIPTEDVYLFLEPNADKLKEFKDRGDYFALFFKVLELGRDLGLVNHYDSKGWDRLLPVVYPISDYWG